MNGTITKVDAIKPSYNGGQYQYVFFKMEDGASARTMLVPTYRNYNRWRTVIEIFKKNPDKLIVLKGLVMKGRMVDADSQFSLADVTRAPVE